MALSLAQRYFRMDGKPLEPEEMQREGLKWKSSAASLCGDWNAKPGPQGTPKYSYANNTLFQNIE